MASDSDVAAQSAERLGPPRVVCRRISSSDESGFSSDLSDDSASPSSATDEAVYALNGHVVTETELDAVRKTTCLLVADVVASMAHGHSSATARPSDCEHSATMIRVVHDLSSKHEIVFEGITKRLKGQINGHRDAEICRRTFVGVVDELFADERYNWGRIVTVFAYAGWLARMGEEGCSAGDRSETNVKFWQDTVIDVAGEYIGVKLSRWICEHGGWAAMEKFFAEPVSTETKLWNGLLYTFFGLGVLATVAAVTR